MGFSITTAYLLCILFSTTIYSCAATPTPILSWLRPKSSEQDRAIDDSNNNNINNNNNFLLSRYGPIQLLTHLGNGTGHGDSIMDVPTTAIRIPSPAVIASAVSSESERLSLLNNNNNGGKILEATLQFEQSQQYAGMSSVLGIMVDDELVVSFRKLMPLKCRFYVGDDSDGDDGDYGLQAAAAAASAEQGGWTAVGDAIGFYRPKVIDQLVDGIKCFAWIEEMDGLPVGFSDERRGNIDAVLLGYLDGVSDHHDDEEEEEEDDGIAVSDDLLSSIDGAGD